MIYDGIAANGKHSFTDFGLTIAGRVDNPPEKKSIRETVPFMNGYHDFSAIAGEVTWGERQLEYEFDIIGNSPQHVEKQRDEVMAWLTNIHEAEIFDDTTPEYHYVGSYESADPEFDETGLRATLTVSFVCQPFKIANRETVLALEIGENRIANPGRSIIARVDCAGTCNVTINDETQTITGTDVELLMPIRAGVNMLTVTGAAATLRFHAEVI